MAKNNHARIPCLLRPAAAILTVICMLSFTSVQAFSSSHYRQIAQLPSHWRTGGSSVGRTHHQNAPLRRHAETVDSRDNPVGYDPLETANGIEPETKSLPKSLTFYIRFVVERLARNRLDQKVKNYKKGRRRAMWNSLNEQRKNIVALAGYTSHIVVPSFAFLFLGALMSSITPHYYSICIQLVSTLSGTKQELIKAILGLGIVSILEALFTGLRGSLFWIGGTLKFRVGCSSYCLCCLASEAVSVRSQNLIAFLVCRLSCQLQCSCQASSQFAVAGGCVFRHERNWISVESLEFRCQ